MPPFQEQSEFNGRNQYLIKAGTSNINLGNILDKDGDKSFKTGHLHTRSELMFQSFYVAFLVLPFLPHKGFKSFTSV